ncbi:hypothetical protein AAP_02748 [Ascosphaera apis ARSEF 7405]|uniref:Uncharacterized protein n=1 Tax=Ascosphaera apis ARSEF 7405 TaxID=392613 RepID=A0A167ZHI8_9EURO|nr:hypothetical protein AAP_02748 [Ascosphaera apis ARSEF 7405]
MDLVEHYRVLLQSHPRCFLVVNYPGWIFGLGLEIATLFIRSLGLTDLVYMSEKGPTEVVEPLAHVAQECNIAMTILPSQPTNFVSRSSSQLRTMQMMSYFHTSQEEGGDETWFSDPLIQRRPFVVSYTGKNKGILGVMVTGSGHDMEFLKELLEGSVVGVVVVDDSNPLVSTSSKTNGFDSETEAMDEDSEDTQADKASELIKLNKDNIPYIVTGDQSNGGLDPSTSRSLGLAIIHSIDIENGSFRLYTPVPLPTIRTVIEQGHQIVLVKGQSDPPHWAISEGYFAARTAQLKHRQLMALAKEKPAADPASEAARHHELSIQSMILRDQVRLAGHVPWMHVTMNDAASEAKEAENRTKVFRLRKKTNETSGAGDSDAEW